MKTKLIKSFLFLALTITVLQSFAMQTDTTQVFVKTLTGQTITVNIDPNATANQLYQACSDASGIAVDRIRLILLRKEIQNNSNKIKNYNIQKESIVHMVIRQPAKESDDILPSTSSSDSVTLSAGPGGGSGAGAPTSAALPANSMPINLVNAFKSSKFVTGSYIPGVTTNSEIYRQALSLENPGFGINRLIAVRGGNPVAIADNDEIFEGPSSDGSVKVLFRENASLPAGAGSVAGAPASATDILPEAAGAPAVALAVIEKALIDIEKLDLTNLVQVEAKLRELGATYNGLINLDLEEKTTILNTILEYKELKAFKAIHTLLKHNQFKI